MLSAVLLQDCLPVSARTRTVCLINEGIEKVVDQTKCIRKPRRQFDGAQECLGGVSQDRCFVVAAGTFFSPAQFDLRTNTEPAGELSQRDGAHNSRPQLGQLAFGLIRERPVQIVGNTNFKDGVT